MLKVVRSHIHGSPKKAVFIWRDGWGSQARWSYYDGQLLIVHCLPVRFARGMNPRRSDLWQQSNGAVQISDVTGIGIVHSYNAIDWREIRVALPERKEWRRVFPLRVPSEGGRKKRCRTFLDGRRKVATIRNSHFVRISRAFELDPCNSFRWFLTDNPNRDGHRVLVFERSWRKRFAGVVAENVFDFEDEDPSAVLGELTPYESAVHALRAERNKVIAQGTMGWW